MKRILFVSGSLRKGSLNTSLLRQAASFFSEFDCIFLDYRDVPLLNQDEEFPAPESVEKARKIVGDADAIFIATPEYNHSYSAALKNLIDWLSRPATPGDYSTAAIRGKTVALCAAAGSSGGSFSLDKLQELLEMLSCKVVDERVEIKLGSRFGKTELVLDDEETVLLKAQCDALRNALQ